MKKLILSGIVILFTLTSTFSQTKVKGTLYKADYWVDILSNGSWSKAMDNPTREKVEVLLTEKYIKVTFGTKVFKYIIISKNKFSEVCMNYNVTLNSEPFVLSFAIITEDLLCISIDKVWMITKVKSSTEVEVSE